LNFTWKELRVDLLLLARCFEIAFEAVSVSVGTVFVSVVLHGYLRSWFRERKER
jgi:hypothetical protein